jgi:hypothetical protein
MKKYKLILLLSLLFGSFSAFPCGGVWNACGTDDVIDLGSDALDNCCAGSAIVIHDICEGNAFLMVVPENGSNSSCAGSFA